jgi:quercetin dioxygenase-like cupin family protein
MTAGIVRFAPGSRVTDGVALVQARGGEAVAVHPGETVYTPPGEWHWHGATESNFLTHLALSETVPAEEGPPVTWGEHLTVDEYRAAKNAVRS